MLLGHWLEMKSVISASNALESLAKLLPDTAHLIKNNDIVDVDISNLKNGDIILIKPLEKIPADGKIVKGGSYLNESMITGVASIFRFIHFLLLVFLRSVIGVCNRENGNRYDYSMPPCFGLAIPLVSAVSTSIAAKNGLLIRNRTVFESSKNITVLAFDKTGTLTKGNFSVTRIISLDENYRESDIVKFAASLEKTSEHPIVKGIMEKLKALGLSETEIVSDFKILKGEGVEGKIKDNAVKLVSKRYVEKNGFDIDIQEELDIGSVVFLIINKKPVGVVILADEIRKDSFDAIKRLKRLGIKCWMITGDDEKVAKTVSDKLQLDGYYAQVLPHDKLDKINKFKGRGKFVAMTGDGTNVRPALTLGTDAAIEAIYIIL